MRYSLSHLDNLLVVTVLIAVTSNSSFSMYIYVLVVLSFYQTNCSLTTNGNTKTNTSGY